MENENNPSGQLPFVNLDWGRTVLDGRLPAILRYEHRVVREANDMSRLQGSLDGLSARSRVSIVKMEKTSSRSRPSTSWAFHPVSRSATSFAQSGQNRVLMSSLSFGIGSAFAAG